MDDYIFKKGMILVYCDKKWRILGHDISTDDIIAIELDVNYRNISKFNISNDLIPQLQVGACFVKNQEVHPIIGTLSSDAKKQFEKNREIIDILDIRYGPSYYYELSDRKAKPILKIIQEKYDIKKDALNNLILRYLQSGFAEYSLVDHRYKGYSSPKKTYQYEHRPGRTSEDSEIASIVIVTETIKKYFDEAIDLHKNGKVTYLLDAYALMKDKYFKNTSHENGERRHLSITQCPTERQFLYYVQLHYNRKERLISQNGEKDWENNYRPLFGNANVGVSGVGDRVECDIIDADIFLSAFDNNNELKTVGKPHVYMGIDISTRLILSLFVTYTNNSMDGARGFFTNFATDKIKLCKKYGIRISEEEWPSNIYPLRVSFDNGSDFASDQMSILLQQLGIERVLQPTAMGSLKPCIERSFREISDIFKPVFREYGVVIHSQKYRYTAKLDIDDFTKVVIYYVIYHNKKYLEYYPATKEMIEDKVELTPIKLFDYMVRKYGFREIKDQCQFVWNCLAPSTASITRKGIIFHNLSYLPDIKDDPELYCKIENISKFLKLTIRYYPSDMNQIYYLNSKNIIVTARLNEVRGDTESYKNLTEEEVKYYQKLKRKMDKLGRHINDELFCDLRERLEEIKSEAAKRPAPKPDKMAEMHAQEKAKNLKSNSPVEYFEGSEKNKGSVNNILEEETTCPEKISENTFQEIDLYDVLKEFG